MKRRSFLQGTLSAGAAGMAASAGLLTPQALLAGSHGGDMAANFKLDNIDAAMEAMGGKDAAESKDIALKAPEIAENGAVVPVTVSSGIEGTTQISILVPNNPTPLAAVFNLNEQSLPTASVRLKMGKTSDVVALVNAGDASYMAKQEVKVTIGGCGG